MPAKNDILSVADAALELGVSDRQVRNLIAAGKIATTMIGGTHVIRRSALDALPKDRKPGRPRKASKKK